MPMPSRGSRSTAECAHARPKQRNRGCARNDQTLCELMPAGISGPARPSIAGEGREQRQGPQRDISHILHRSRRRLSEHPEPTRRLRTNQFEQQAYYVITSTAATGNVAPITLVSHQRSADGPAARGCRLCRAALHALPWCPVLAAFMRPVGERHDVVWRKHFGKIECRQLVGPAVAPYVTAGLMFDGSGMT